MFGNKTKVQMTEDEKTILILALNELRNKLLSEGRFTDAVDELKIGLRPAVELSYIPKDIQENIFEIMDITCEEGSTK